MISITYGFLCELVRKVRIDGLIEMFTNRHMLIREALGD